MDPFADLARQIPAEGDPVEAWSSVERRAAAIRRRRRVVAGGGVVVLLLAAIAAVIVLPGDESIDVVTTTPETTGVPRPTGAPTTSLPPETTEPAETTAPPDAAGSCENGIAGGEIAIADGVPTEAEAVAVVQAFLSARQAAAGSPSDPAPTEPFGCLDVASLEEAGFARVIEVRDVQPFGSTGSEQIVTALIETPDGLAREELRVAAVDGRAVIVDIRSTAVTSIAEADARAVLTAFLDALAAAEWEIAADLLVNEGASEAVLTQMPELLDQGADAVEAWCATDGRCDEAYEIGGRVSVEPFALGFEVFFGRDGLPPTTMQVLSFEGQLSVGSLPPTR